MCIGVYVCRYPYWCKCEGLWLHFDECIGICVMGALSWDRACECECAGVSVWVLMWISGYTWMSNEGER